MLEFRTFGTIDLRHEDGKRLSELLGQPKRLALLAYLADRQPSGPVRREQLLELLWPDSAPSDARHSLSVTFSRLRRALGEEVIRGRGEETLWLSSEHLRSDVAAFQETRRAGRPRKALDLYRGPFLKGFRPPDARPFEEWAEERRRTYRRRAYEAGLGAGESARERDDLQGAVECFRRAHDLNPLEEEAARRLIEALAEQGKRGEALKLYTRFRQRLRDELGLTPSAEIEESVSEIQTQESFTPKPGARDDVDPDGGVDAASVTGRGEASSVSTGDSSPVRRLAVGLVLVFGLASAGLWAWEALGSASADGNPADAGGAVAVIPFRALGEDEPGAFTEGMHSNLQTRLAAVSGLSVKAPRAVAKYRDTRKRPKVIAEELGARWIVSGEVQRIGDRIRIDVRLVDPRTETHAWSDTYRRDLTTDGLFGIQTDIVKNVARSLEIRLTPEERASVERRPTDNLQAYKLYVQGRSHLDTRTAAGMRRAVTYFRRAIERDSSYAWAWSGLADAIGLYPSYATDSLPGSLPAHERAARRAVELGPDVAEARASLGYAHLLQQKGPEALRQLQRAVALKPSYAQGHHWLAALFLYLGRQAPALKHLDRAFELNPQLFQGVMARGDAGTTALRAPTHLRLPPMMELYSDRKWEELETRARQNVREDEDTSLFSHFYLVRIAALRGDTNRARRWLAGIQKREKSDRRLLAEGLGHAALGEDSAAFSAWQEMNTAAASPMRTLIFRETLHGFSDLLGPLREDSRYRELIRTINRAWGLSADGSIPDGVDVSYAADSGR